MKYITNTIVSKVNQEDKIIWKKTLSLHFEWDVYILLETQRLFTQPQHENNS